MAKPMLHRYTARERSNHWFVALMFVLAGLSGLALFHPSLYFFSHLFGGGPWSRILHPFLGLLMVLGFVFLFFRFRKENRFTQVDREWRAHIGDTVRGHKDAMPPAGKYNWGQKMVFWAMTFSLILLLVTGFMFWEPWFTPYFSVMVGRVAVLVHAIAALVLVLVVIVHVYAAIWVKGTMRGMTRGTVTESWARRNHALWHREVTKGS